VSHDGGLPLLAAVNALTNGELAAHYFEDKHSLGLMFFVFARDGYKASNIHQYNQLSRDCPANLIGIGHPWAWWTVLQQGAIPGISLEYAPALLNYFTGLQDFYSNAAGALCTRDFNGQDPCIPGHAGPPRVAAPRRVA
jgi:hypothetical protein